MKIINLLLLCLFTLASCSHGVRSPAAIHSYIHVVLDIDWTISSEVDPSFVGKRTILVDEKKYFIHDGLEEFIENLLSKNDIQISFFSGGSKKRNLALLSQIKISDGRTLADIAFKVLGKEDLSVVPDALPSDKFSLRFKKDLSKISSDFSNLVMIDDTQHFVLNSEQEELVLFTGKTFQHFENFSDAKMLSGEYVPKTLEEWSFARKKLFILNGALEHAYQQSKVLGLSFREAVKLEESMLDLSSGQWNDYSNNLYQSALRFKIQNSPTAGCVELLRPFVAI